MNDPRPARRRRRKKILRRSDGSLYDVSERRPISVVELREYVRDGGFFEARREGTGADCTHEILQGIVGTGLLENLLPGMSGGGPLSGLGALGALAGGGGGLGALGNGSEGLPQLARLLGDDRNHRESDWDYHDEPRRSPRRDHRRREGWDDPPRRRSEHDVDDRRDWWDEPRPHSRERHPDDERDAWDDPPRRSGRRGSRRGWEFEDE
jgi:hypothetical protein